MIELTVQDIVNNIEIVKEFANMSLPAITAYHASRILKKITEEYNIYQDTRQRILNKYAEKDEHGQLRSGENHMLIFADDNREKAINELQKVLEEKITLDVPKMNISEWDGINFTPSQMYLLNMFIEE